MATKFFLLRTNTSKNLVLDNVHHISVKHVDFRAGENKPLKRRKDAGTKQEHVVFINLEHDGPSAIEHILLRFSEKNNLTFTRILPRNATSTCRYTNSNQSEAVDILTAYCNIENTDKKVKPNATKVVILGKPTSSIASKLHSLSKANSSGTHHPIVNSHESRLPLIQPDVIATCLGIEKDLTLPMTPYIIARLENLRRQFDLILLQERLEESLILLRRTLGWSFIDVLYINRKTINYGLEMAEKEKELFKGEHDLDLAIYVFFTKIFDQQIKDLGTDFDEEVSHFRIILTQLLGYCNQRTMPTGDFSIEATVWHGDIFISWKYCSKFEVRYRS